MISPRTARLDHRMEQYSIHIGRPLGAGERAAFLEGYDAGSLANPLPCPYVGELAPVWQAGRVLKQAMLLRIEPTWPTAAALTA